MRKKTFSKNYYDDQIKSIGPNGEIILKDDISTSYSENFKIEEELETNIMLSRLKITKIKEKLQSIRDEERNFD